MDHKRRGLAVIINNEKFKHLPTRAWSDVDVKQLTEALEFLGFDVETHENQTAYQMLGIFKSGKFELFLFFVFVCFFGQFHRGEIRGPFISSLWPGTLINLSTKARI